MDCNSAILYKYIPKNRLISYDNAKKSIRILLWIVFKLYLLNSALKVMYILKFLVKWKTKYVNTSVSVACSALCIKIHFLIFFVDF